MRAYSDEQLERLGNTILYLESHIRPLCKTKLLKLVYLQDELSTARNGIPFLGLEYKRWQFGPVDVDLFGELDEPFLLDSFIELEHDDRGTKIVGKKKFNDDEFREVDINL